MTHNSLSSSWSDISRPGSARIFWEARFVWEGARLFDRLRSLPLVAGPVQVHAYLSEAPEVRQTLELGVAEHFGSLGQRCAVRVRSAYKTGYFWVSEEVRPIWRRAQADRLVLTYPSGPPNAPDRYLQELYPLSALLDQEGLQWEFIAGTPDPTYTVQLFRGDTSLWQGECLLPLHLRSSLDGREVPAPTGWLQVVVGDEILCDERLETDGELFWDWYCEAVIPQVLALADQRPGKPVFKNLQVTLALSEPDLPIGVLDERVSMTEALSEEVYFGTVEALKRHLGAQAHSRTLMPGRIVPVVNARPGQDGWARVVLKEWQEEQVPVVPGTAPSLVGEHRGGAASPGLSVPHHPRQIWATARQEAERFDLEWHVPAMSVEGRPIPAVVRTRPSGGGILVTGGQHANETTGPVAAVQLIAHLAGTALAFAVLPLENPDGAMLHRSLIQFNPEHMHHAARYTSLGDDLEYRLRVGNAQWESRGRQWAAETVNAAVHLNLHGYPAHEWVRPYSGYAPFGFESWAIPAGFLTIIWHHEGLETSARQLAERIASELQHHRDVVQHAERACRAHMAHNSHAHYELIGGLPFIISEQSAALCPITVITEAPDETIYGASFQMFVRAHLAVCEVAVAYQSGRTSDQRTNQ